MLSKSIVQSLTDNMNSVSYFCPSFLSTSHYSSVVQEPAVSSPLTGMLEIQNLRYHPIDSESILLEDLQFICNTF